jgi:hypothetical protein
MRQADGGERALTEMVLSIDPVQVLVLYALADLGHRPSSMPHGGLTLERRTYSRLKRHGRCRARDQQLGLGVRFIVYGPSPDALPPDR